MEKNIVEEIRNDKQQPLIAVIGATFPTNEYKRDRGIEVGYLLRKYIDKREGTLFTGGVNGIGVDVYTGIIKYCVDYLKENRTMPDDRFFVLTPMYAYIPPTSKLSLEKKEYFEPPETYYALGAISKRESLEIVTAGEDLAERRNYLSKLADVLITINGGSGTFDEALGAIQNKKPVITMSYSGGAAFLLGEMKNPSQDVYTFDKGIMKILGDAGDIDTDLIYVASNTAEMIKHLDSLL